MNTDKILNSVKQWANKVWTAVKKGVTDFVWWINDTMNAPARVLGDAAVMLTKNWTKANDLAKSYRDTAYGVTNIWQDKSSGAYALGRTAPIAAASVATPAAWFSAAPLVWEATMTMAEAAPIVYWVWLTALSNMASLDTDKNVVNREAAKPAQLLEVKRKAGELATPVKYKPYRTRSKKKTTAPKKSTFSL